MNLPTKQQCFEIFKEHKVPQNIIEHCLMVNKIAVFLAEKLKQKGIDINIDLLDRASLLHDLDKIPTKNQIIEHGELSKKIMTEKGYPELGKLIKVHTCENIKEGLVNTWEEKLLNYADIRVLNDKIVSAHKRFEDGRKRYPHFAKPEHRITEKLAFEIEKEIFSHLDFKPEELEEEMKNRKV